MAIPDKSEKIVRFGCGFIFGLLVGGINTVYFLHDAGYGTAAIVLVLAVISAFLSMRCGSVFWRWIAKWISF